MVSHSLFKRLLKISLFSDYNNLRSKNATLCCSAGFHFEDVFVNFSTNQTPRPTSLSPQRSKPRSLNRCVSVNCMFWSKPWVLYYQMQYKLVIRIGQQQGARSFTFGNKVFKHEIHMAMEQRGLTRAVMGPGNHGKNICETKPSALRHPVTCVRVQFRKSLHLRECWGRVFATSVYLFFGLCLISNQRLYLWVFYRFRFLNTPPTARPGAST